MFGQGIAGPRRLGSPIRRPADRRVCAPTHGLSRLAASFFGSMCQGIRRAPVTSWPRISLETAARVSLALFQVSNDLKFWDITRMNSDRYSGVAYRDANQNMFHVSYQMLLIFTLIFAIGSDEVITSISQISENLLVTGRSASSSPSLRYAALKVRGVNPGDRVPRRCGQTVLRRTGDPAGHQV